MLTLLLGVLLGYLTKWWQAVGTLLRSQLDRQRRIERQVTKDFRSDLVPSGLEELLQSARQAAESFNGAALKQTLDVIEPRLSPYTRLVANAGRLLNTLQQNEAAADGGHSRGALSAVENAISETVHGSWSDFDEATSCLSELGKVTAVLDQVLAVAAEHRDDGAVTTLGCAERGDWAGVLREVAPPAPAPAAAPVAMAEPGARAAKGMPAKPRVLARIGAAFSLRARPGAAGADRVPIERRANRDTTPAARTAHGGWSAAQKVLLNWVVPIFLFVVTVGVVTFYGLQNQYFNKPTFGAGGLGDWITLFAWGFGTGLAGRAITDFVGAGSAGAKRAAPAPANAPNAA